MAIIGSRSIDFKSMIKLISIECYGRYLFKVENLIETNATQFWKFVKNKRCNQVGSGIRVKVKIKMNTKTSKLGFGHDSIIKGCVGTESAFSYERSVSKHNVKETVFFFLFCVIYNLFVFSYHSKNVFSLVEIFEKIYFWIIKSKQYKAKLLTIVVFGLSTQPYIIES